MSLGIKDRILRWFTVSVILVVIVLGAVTAAPAYRRGEDLKKQDAELQAKIDAKKKEIESLIENQRRFRTDADFVETIARQNRRVYPGELVFVFED